MDYNQACAWGVYAALDLRLTHSYRAVTLIREGEDDWGLSGDSEVVLNRRRRKLWSWDKVERVVKPFCG